MTAVETEKRGAKVGQTADDGRCSCRLLKIVADECDLRTVSEVIVDPKSIAEESLQNVTTARSEARSAIAKGTNDKVANKGAAYGCGLSDYARMRLYMPRSTARTSACVAFDARAHKLTCEV